MSKMIEIQGIKSYLLHRYPFLLVDRVIDVQQGVSVTARKNVSVNEPFFNGHFPQRPVMPGVLIIEAMAQASGVLIFETKGQMPTERDIFYLAGINQARFKRMVVPGDVLEMHVELVKQAHGLWKFKGTASVDGELACTAEFMNVDGGES